MWRAKGIAVAALLLGFTCAASAADTQITIHVMSPFDKPVDNAEVILDFLGSHQVTKLGKRKALHWEMRTNQDGIAHFPPVPQGTLRVQVNARKYQTYGQKFDVAEAEKTLDIKLNEPQPQYSAHPPLKQ
jgi:uncharacterized GH25 family protein